MWKKFAQVSSVACLLAIGAGLPAYADVAGWSGGNEEDAAAPAGSFTSVMSVPVRPEAIALGNRHERLWLRRHAELAYAEHHLREMRQ